MKKEYIIAAKTVEEAITDARIKYGSEGELSFEVLEMPKKGFLGIGSSPAKIKVTVEEEEEDLMAIFGSTKKEARKPEPKKEEKKEPAKKAEKENKSNDKNRANGDRNPKNSEKPKEKTNKQANKPAPEKKEEKPVQAPRREEEAAPVVKEETPVKRLSDEDIRVSREEMDVALSFVTNLLADMEIDAVAVANLEPDADGNVSRVLDIQGPGAGKLIGHHGETLDSIQYLANLALNRKHGSRRHEYVKVVVDIEGYRAKREDTLRQFARRMADKALKYKRNVLLEPMNPYERRIIHSEIQGIEGVSTHSVGSDENRKIVITYDAGPKEGNGGRRNNHHRRRGKKEGKKDTAAAAVPAATDGGEGEEVLREY